MKINRLIAENVFGSLDLDIKFDPQLTFLIGINGSGKTTALKLINGLLMPSYDTLTKIDFKKIRLICSSTAKEKDIIIIAHEMKNKRCKLTLKVRDKIFHDVFPKKVFLDYPENSNIDENEYLSRFRNDFYNLNVVNNIRDLSTPIYLGLDRGALEKRQEDPYVSRRIVHSYRSRSYSDVRIGESIDEILILIQRLLFDFIRRIPDKQQKIIEDFKNEILSLSFEIIRKKKLVIPDISIIDEIQSKIQGAISNLNILGIDQKINSFFQKIINLLNNYNLQDTNENLKKDEIIFALLSNLPQIERIQKIIGISEKFKIKITSLNEPLRRLESIIKEFFIEGNKELIINNDGELNIKINKKLINKEGKGEIKELTRNIFQLSSGEKQILIMIAHLIFYEELKNPGIFIVDEPELSLHLSWQEIFVDSILKASSGTQFILATHAPSIISKQEREINCRDLSEIKS